MEDAFRGTDCFRVTTITDLLEQTVPLDDQRYEATPEKEVSMTLARTTRRLRELNVGGKVTHIRTQESAATTAWGVNWDENMIARDIMQNFYDANRDQLDKVHVTATGSTVTVSAPASYELERLFYLGSEKGPQDVGQYGEGFKVAATCLLRDFNVTPIAQSAAQIVCLRISDKPVPGTDMYPLLYDFFTSDDPYDGTRLILPGCSKRLFESLTLGLDHFFYEGNRMLGSRRWSSHDGTCHIYESTTADGHAFYRNLKRGDIAGIPLVLVINREYKIIENRIKNDRDRNAFGDDVLKTFYRTFAKNALGTYGNDGKRAILEAARGCWERGHPLLAELAATVWWGSTTYYHQTARQIFGDAFFARSPTRDSSDDTRYKQLEFRWQQEGRRPLPQYFERFGVISAKVHFEELQQKASRESIDRQSHAPTAGEHECIDLLKEVLDQLAPGVSRVMSDRTAYTVGETETVLGELRRNRGYRSRDVYLAADVFAADFPEALAVFLHEHHHIFGHDGSRAFTDSLTELLETVVRCRHDLDKFESRWNTVKTKVAEERRKSQQLSTGRPVEEQLAELDVPELRSLLSRIPRIVLQRLLDSRDGHVR